jgi:asparagine N-glycosylation enzyme membrane subunit Stt3
MKLRTILIIITLIVTGYILFTSFSSSYEISQYSGPVLSSNWWVGLNWIKNNTPECSVVATYWDPGHFITGIGDRAVVFDGASQNTVWQREFEGKLSEDQIKKIAVIENYDFEYFEKDGKPYTRITTARIQDIGNSLLTSNETMAVEILKKYVKPDCNNSMYYIASSDLIGKSQWWTYFGTWKKENPDDNKGTKYFYTPTQLGQTKKMIADNATVYTYPLSDEQTFFIYEKDGVMMPYYQQGKDSLQLQKIFYFKGNMGLFQTAQSDNVLKGLLWVSPDMQFVIFVPEELMDSMFTKMYLFNGEGLEKFKMIQNFGGEVKLFQVDLN